VRIIGGEFKGRKLFSVHGEKTRPTADRIREAIFNILSSRVDATVVLDLFAGTGALGLEALSRGARSVIFIEAQKNALSALRRNVNAIGLENRATILKWDILKNLDCLKAFEVRVNLVFMDPPYSRHLVEPTLSNLHVCGCLEADARVIVEHSPREAIPVDELPFHQEDQRTYGKTLVSFLRYVL
jgi:16S rRNA (guanine966-N2)-methyltransferase